MRYTANNTTFSKVDIEAQKASVSSSVTTYLNSSSTLTPSKWAHFKRRSWTGAQKASFIYYVKQNEAYTNPHLTNIHTQYYN